VLQKIENGKAVSYGEVSDPAVITP
jgi:hypothetical protein